MEETKKCKSCARDLPKGAFRKNRLSSDGYTATCLDCIASKRRAKAVDELPPPQTGGKIVDPRFSQFQSRELIAELRRRGYKGTLTFTQEINL